MPRRIKGDTRSLDYSSHRVENLFEFMKRSSFERLRECKELSQIKPRLRGSS